MPCPGHGSSAVQAGIRARPEGGTPRFHHAQAEEGDKDDFGRALNWRLASTTNIQVRPVRSASPGCARRLRKDSRTRYTHAAMVAVFEENRAREYAKRPGNRAAKDPERLRRAREDLRARSSVRLPSQCRRAPAG